MQDGQIDFSKYTLASLKDSLVAVDRARFPLNFNAIKTEIESRTGVSVIQNETDLKVHSLVREMRTSRILLFLGFLAAVIVIGRVYPRESGTELAPWTFGLFICFGAFYFYRQWRESKIKCPACSHELGWFAVGDDDSTNYISTKTCPHCNYTGK